MKFLGRFYVKYVKGFWYKKVRKSVPWLEVISYGISDNGMVRLEFDWNTAFIEHIRKHGFHGHNEEECIEGYIMALNRNPVKEIGDPMPVGVPSGNRIYTGDIDGQN